MVNHINLENITYEDRIKLNRIFFNYFLINDKVTYKVEKYIDFFKNDLNDLIGVHIRSMPHFASIDGVWTFE
jgi:hypothetical protein